MKRLDDELPWGERWLNPLQMLIVTSVIGSLIWAAALWWAIA